MNGIPTTESTSFIAAFRRHCHDAAEQSALEQGKHSLNYAQLDALSDAFAHCIDAAELRPEQSIALYCDRSVHAIAALLGSLKCGVAFVPIDPSFPDERIHYMLDDASVALMLTDASSESRAIALTSNNAMKIVRVDAVAAADYEQKGQYHYLDRPDRRAYIMYTSGSTGRPKGVPISQSALACYCLADAEVYGLRKDDRTLQFSTLSFDISIEEIFPPLMCGSSVVLRPANRGDASIELSDIILRFGITAVHLATGYWHEWVDLMISTDSVVPDCLRLMVVTGEKVSPEHYARWQSLCSHDVLWANAYGPTEATVSATVFIPPVGWQGSSLPIGKALPGYTTYILDEKLAPIEDGQTGELYIGGGALAEGYLNQPELTQKAFIANPFEANGSSRLYRTGDLARWLDDGVIEYAGRIDHQMKVGSYRIEPAEIENRINQLSGVLESLVTVVSNDARAKLIAYVAVTRGLDDAGKAASDLKQQLSLSLPVYMVPSFYVLVAELPKTLNGKIDRDALPNPASAVLARQTDTVEARTDAERVLCDIWSDVLGITEVGIHDSFVSLGGDSLMAVRAIARIHQRLDFSISTRDFFFLDTIALLAGHMEGREVPRLVPPVNTFFINRRNRQLYSVMQSPSPSNANGIGILLVPPLGNEQRRYQRPQRAMMHKLARDGFHLSRFDWQGTANSSGFVKDIHDLSHWGEDLHDAVEELGRSVDQISLVSVRFGALVTAMYPINNMSVTASYCWDPVFSGRQWLADMQKLQRGICADTYRFLFKRKSRKGDLHEFAGISVNSSLFHQIEHMNLVEALQSNPSAYPVNLLVGDGVNNVGQLPVNCKVHSGCDHNDWTDPRSTTQDMQINRTASLSYDLIVAASQGDRQCA